MSAAVLAPLAAIYETVVSARASLYLRGRLRSESAPAPVISIGNIVAGGTGKTPFAAHTAALLRDAGHRPAILSRGYRGRRSADPMIVSEGRGVLDGVDASSAGDEPVMLASRLAGVPVVVARRRIEGARLAVSRLGADCLLLDDGFQHLALRRDLDIVLLDAESPLDDGRLLPAGMLREPPGALARAGALVFTRSVGSDAASVASARGISARTLARPGTPSFQVSFSPTLVVSARDVDPTVRPDPETLTASWLSGMRIVAFAGIAKPQRFVEDLRRLGGEVVSFLGFSDHHVFRARDVEEILSQVRRLEAEVLITTEKDVARLKGTRLAEPLIRAGLVALRLEPAFAPGEEEIFREMLLATVRAPAAAGGGS